jgi:hypothetical protein
MWHAVEMIQPRSIIIFVSGIGFALAVVLSCNRGHHITIDASVADASVADASPPGVGVGSDVCCSSITVSGVTKTVSAENDAAQLRSSVIPLSPQFNGKFYSIVSGPIVITNILQFFEPANAENELFLSPSEFPCGPSPVNAFFTLSASAGRNEFSGRLWIPAGQTLCVWALSTTSSSGYLMYSGFMPY